MPYQPIRTPELEPIANPYQIVGQAVSGLGSTLAGISEREAKRKADIEAMIQARADAIYKKNQDARAAKDLEIKAAEEARKAAADKRQQDYLKELNKGHQISKTLAESPNLATSRTKPTTSGPSQADLDALELESPNLPSQNVIAGQDSTAMMGEALNRQMAGSDLGGSPLNREEVLDLAHRRGQITPENYASATKPSAEARIPFGEDPVLKKDIDNWLKTPSIQNLLKDPSNKARAALSAEGLARGFSGQKAFESIFGNVPPESQTLETTKGQNLFQNIRATVNDFETQPSIVTMKTAVTKFKRADRVYQDYLNSPPQEKDDKRRAVQETMLFGFAKSLDENSAVMYNEFERILAGQGWTDEMLNALKSKTSGGLKVNDKQLAGFHNAMRLINQELVDEAKPAFESFKEDLDILDPSATKRKTRPWEQYFNSPVSAAKPPEDPGKALADKAAANPNDLANWPLEDLQALKAYRQGLKK